MVSHLPDNLREEIADWYRLYGDDIFKYIFMMVNDYQQAEDLTQDTFVKAYKHYRSFNHQAKPKTWLYSIARHTTVDYMRKRKPLQLFQEFFQSKRDPDPLPEELIEIRESSMELYHALGNLKPAYREVIILRKIKTSALKKRVKF